MVWAVFCPHRSLVIRMVVSASTIVVDTGSVRCDEWLPSDAKREVARSDREETGGVGVPNTPWTRVDETMMVVSTRAVEAQDDGVPCGCSGGSGCRCWKEQEPLEPVATACC